MIEFIYLKQPPCRYTMEKAPKLKEWIVSKIKKYNCENVLNLFAGKTIISDGSFKEIRIDLDKEMPLLDENIDADIYIDKCIQNNVKYDCILSDPPFSIRKSREKYEGRYIGCYTKLKNKLPLLLNKNGIIIEFGFTAMGMSNSRGFELKDLCIVAHGGDHSATIITVETLK